MERGQGLAHILMTSPDLDDQPKRDLVYLIAVADYKLGNILQARKQLRALLEVKVPTTDNIVWGNQGMIWWKCMLNMYLLRDHIGVGVTLLWYRTVIDRK
jgi:hypothetical protein